MMKKREEDDNQSEMHASGSVYCIVLREKMDKSFQISKISNFPLFFFLVFFLTRLELRKIILVSPPLVYTKTPLPSVRERE